MAELSVLERVRLALIELEKSKRILICRPEHEAAVRAAVAELCPFEHLLEVRVEPWLPEGQFLLIDPNAIEAASRELLQRPVITGWALDRYHFPTPVLSCGCVQGFPCYRHEKPDPRKLVIITGI